MEAGAALKAFRSQRNKAKQRGIGWSLTFKQWCDWWGEDIANRGPGRFQLSMQRILDSGPYALGNIRKGYPKENGSTRACVARNLDQAERKRQWLAAQSERDISPPDPVSENEQELAALGYNTLWNDGRWQHMT